MRSSLTASCRLDAGLWPLNSENSLRLRVPCSKFPKDRLKSLLLGRLHAQQARGNLDAEIPLQSTNNERAVGIL